MTEFVRSDAIGAALADMTPLLRRVVSLDPGALVRVRATPGRLTMFVRLPFAVLAARTVAAASDESLDRTVVAHALLSWLDGERAEPPQARDAGWRGAAPPSSGWQRLETVPDGVVRGLVRTCAVALKDAAAREGVPGAQPRAEVTDALLDSVVLTAQDGDRRAEVTLRTLSALTRMGFLARDSAAAIDVAGRWVRVAGEYGSVFAEAQSAGLSVVRPG